MLVGCFAAGGRSINWLHGWLVGWLVNYCATELTIDGCLVGVLVGGLVGTVVGKKGPFFNKRLRQLYPVNTKLNYLSVLYFAGSPPSVKNQIQPRQEPVF